MLSEKSVQSNPPTPDAARVAGSPPVNSPPRCVSKQFSSEPQSISMTHMLLQHAREETASIARFHHGAACE
jgi:hypothetical protein